MIAQADEVIEERSFFAAPDESAFGPKRIASELHLSAFAGYISTFAVTVAAKADMPFCTTYVCE